MVGRGEGKGGDDCYESGERVGELLNDRVRFEVTLCSDRWSISLNEDKVKEKSDQRRGTDVLAII